MQNKTIQAYNRCSDIYHQETEEFWANFPTSITEAFTSNLAGKQVLDVGSGSGRDALILKDKGLEVICVDAAKSMVERTRKLGFKSYLMDFVNLEFPKESFDGVWAYTSLLHVPKTEAEKVLEKIHQILKPAGAFLIGMIEGNFEGEIEREGWEETKRYFRYYSEKELVETVTSAGFTLTSQERYRPGSKTYLSQIYVKGKI